MQTTSPLASPPPPESEHRCPECLWMDFKLVPVRSEFDASASSPQESEIDLLLSIQFGEQVEPIYGGKVSFGLRRGELKLKLENCEMPLSNIALCDRLETTLSVERSITTGTDHQSGIEANFSEGNPGITAGRHQTRRDERSDTFQFDVSQVSTKGSPQNLVWVFEEKMGEPVLKGLLSDTKMGTLIKTGASCCICATFEVLSRDIKLTGIEGPWFVNLLPEKRSALDRSLALRFLRHKLQPHLSRVDLQYPD